MLSDNLRDDLGLIQPIERDAFMDEWLADPSAVLQQARESELELDQFTRARAPASAERPGRSTAEWMLFNEGYRMVDTFDIPSSRVEGIDLDPQRGADMEPIAHLMTAYWDEAYNRTLLTGERAASLSTQTVGSPWRRYYDETPTRAPDIAPGFDLMRVMAYSRTISEDKFRIPTWENATGEQRMQAIAEGTSPKLFEITRKLREVSLDNYRAGIEATDSFLNDSQTRASDITNAVEEIAIGHRIALLAQFGKLLKDSVRSDRVFTPTGTVGGITFASGVLDYPHFRQFMKSFGAAYRPNICIGNSKSILDLELMSMTGGNQNLTFGTWTLIPNSNVENLNGDLTQLAYGDIDADSVTGFVDSELFVFPRETSFAFVQRRGMDQDEMERVAGPRKTRRWFGTQSGIAPLDLFGLRRMNYA